jgi:hypothetical protein
MENWRKRWERFMFTEDMIVGGGTVLNPKPETYSDFVRMLDDIENFISQELDRAREEGIKDGMRGMIDILCEKGCGSMFAVIKEKDVNKKIKELSKLTTK